MDCRGAHDERGFTLVELLVASLLLAVLSVGFYSVLFNVTRSSERGQNVVRVSEEARLGFNRMVRDTREAEELTAASAMSFSVEVDFNADGAIAPAPSPNPVGDYEALTFSYSEADHTIRLNSEVLMENVDCVRSAGACTQDSPVFSYYSNHLEYDWDGDGMASWQELDAAPSHGVVGVGNGNGVLDAPELALLSSVRFALAVTDGDEASTFYNEAQLRNRR